ncbi:hypothetical protein BDA96_05G246100 [Sorghum bicolor]|uniref:Uncharacterized protein n=1 Tax=Sorghum bicolor TaxID=4558 RepID=A0A921UGX2_SORBI|nr:hypothetical protein BDA96_05G246100 [Sorghum bicolor]
MTREIDCSMLLLVAICSHDRMYTCIVDGQQETMYERVASQLRPLLLPWRQPSTRGAYGIVVRLMSMSRCRMVDIHQPGLGEVVRSIFI